MITKYFNKIKHKESGNFFLIAGPCVVENESVVFETAEKLIQICDNLKIPLIFKASYRKANRTKLDSFTGIGDEKALKILKKVGRELDVDVITDIHLPAEAFMAASYVDALQIPAFLARQTDLLLAAAKTNLPINVKKGQFMSPEAMRFAVQKIRDSSNNSIMLTERGSMFGYGDLVVDFRSIPIMKKFGADVIVDITHSLQVPNQASGVTGGNPEMIETIAKAAIAVGTDGIFMETHPKPEIAKSDGANMIALDNVEKLLTKLVNIRKAINES